MSFREWVCQLFETEVDLNDMDEESLIELEEIFEEARK